MRSSRSSISFSTASLNARWSAKAGSTYHRINRRRNGLDRPALADDRPLRRHRPEPLGLVARRQPHLRRRHVGRPRPGRPHLLLQPREERGDIDLLLGLGHAEKCKRGWLRQGKQGAGTPAIKTTVSGGTA